MAESAPNDRRTLGDASEVAKQCEAMEAELAALRGSYEQYFLGVERRPPTDQYNAFKKKLNGIRNTFVRQVTAKFLVGNLATKFATYERLWQRTLKEMEDGTYRRDVFKARLRNKTAQKKAAAGKTSTPDTTSEDVDLNDFDDLDEVAPAPKAVVPAAAPAVAALKPVSAPATGTGAGSGTKPLAAPATGKGPGSGTKPLAAPAAGAGPASGPRPVATPAVGAGPAAGPRPLAVPAQGQGPSSSSSPLAVSARPAGPTSASHQVAPVAAASANLSDLKVKAIYDAYVMAKRRCNEDTSKLTLDTLGATLRKQVPELMKQHNAKSVEFKVVIKDGKAILRALPKD